MDFVTFGFGLGALLMLAGYLIRDHGRKLLFGDGQGLEGMPPTPMRSALDRTTLHAFAAGLTVAGFVATVTTFVALIAGLSDFHGAIVVGVVVVLAIIGAGYWGYDVLRRHAIDAAIIDQQDLTERRRLAREAAKKPAAPNPVVAVPAATRQETPGTPAAVPPVRPTVVDVDRAVTDVLGAPEAAASNRLPVIADQDRRPGPVVAESPVAQSASVAPAAPTAPGSSATAYGDVLPPAPPAQASPLAARFGGLPAGWQAAAPPPFTRQPAVAGAPGGTEPAAAERPTVPPPGAPRLEASATAATTPDEASPVRPAWSPWSVASATGRASSPPPAPPAPAEPQAVTGEAVAQEPDDVTPPPVAAPIAPAPHAPAPIQDPVVQPVDVPAAPVALDATAPLPTVPPVPEPAAVRRPATATVAPAGAPPDYQPPEPEPVVVPTTPRQAAVRREQPSAAEADALTDEGTPVELLPLRVAPKRRFGKPSVSTKPATPRPGDAPAKRPGEGEPQPSLLGYEHVFEQDQDADLPAWPGERPASATRPASPEPPPDGRSLTDPASYAQRGASPTWLFDDLEDELAAMPAPREEPIDPFRFVRPVKKISVLDKLLAEGPATNGEPGRSGT